MAPDANGFVKATPDYPARCRLPDYPSDARRNRETGFVSAEFLVDAEGNVQGSRLVQSSGHATLDNAAIQALAKCHFKPATQNGQPVMEPRWTEVHYTWSLQ